MLNTVTENKNETMACVKDVRSQRKDGSIRKPLLSFSIIVFNMMKLLQWRIQGLLDAVIPVWAAKLRTYIKEKLKEKTECSMQLCLNFVGYNRQKECIIDLIFLCFYSSLAVAFMLNASLA